jgi:hypothetical protein
MRRLRIVCAALSTTLAALVGTALAQQAADPRLAGAWKMANGPEITITQSSSGWSAGHSMNAVPMQGSDPVIVKSASAQHITLVAVTPDNSLCFAGLQDLYELDLSSDGKNLVGKVETATGSCGDWDDRGDHRMTWVSVLFTRVQ